MSQTTRSRPCATKRNMHKRIYNLRFRCPELSGSLASQISGLLPLPRAAGTMASSSYVSVMSLRCRASICQAGHWSRWVAVGQPRAVRRRLSFDLRLGPAVFVDISAGLTDPVMTGYYSDRFLDVDRKEVTREAAQGHGGSVRQGSIRACLAHD